MIYMAEKIASLAAVLFYGIMLMTQRKRVEKTALKAGNLLLELNRPSRKNVFIIWTLCPLIIVLSFLTKRNQWITILMSLLVIAGMYVVCMDDAFNSNNGIYEKGIILSGMYIQFSEIESMKESGAFNGYDVTLNSGKTVQIFFHGEEEVSKARIELEKHVKL